MISVVRVGTIPEVKIPFELTPRVRIRAELATLNGWLRAPFNDMKTREIFVWHDDFIKCLDGVGEYVNPAIAVFAEKLSVILVDAKGATLEDPLLGNDGYLYGRKALCCYISDLSEEKRGRSPMNPDRDALFYAIPHPIVEAAIAWLKSRDHFRNSVPQIDRKYEELEKTGKLPEIPHNEVRARRLERVRVLTQEAKMRESEIRGLQKAHEEAIVKEADETIGRLFAPLHKTLHRVESDERAMLDQAIMQDAINSELLSHHEKEIRKFGEEMRERNVELNHRIDKLQEKVSDVKAQGAILKSEIEAAEHAKNSQGSSFWLDVGLVVASAAVSYKLKTLMLASGGSSEFMVTVVKPI